MAHLWPTANFVILSEVFGDYSEVRGYVANRPNSGPVLISPRDGGGCSDWGRAPKNTHNRVTCEHVEKTNKLLRNTHVA